MNTLHRRTYGIVIAIILLAMTALSGCVPPPNGGEATTAAPFTQGTSSGSAEAQEAFRLLSEELFTEEVSQNQLDQHFLIKDPAALKIPAPQSLYSPVSLAEARKNIVDLKNLKKKLSAIDIRLLTEDQQLTMRILENHVDTQLMSEGMELYGQPLAPTIGVQAQLPVLLAEYEFRNRQDVDTYLQLIAGIDEYYEEILALEREQSAAGLMMNDTAINHVIQSCESYLLVPGNNFMTDTFKTRLDALTDLTEDEKNAYITKHNGLLESDFVPAYQLLIDGMTVLKGTGVYEGGLANYPDGKEYYEYLVYSAVGTSYDSIDEMLQAMERLIEDNLKSITTLSRKNPHLLDEINTYAFRQTDPEAILEELKTLASKDFPPLPECSYTLKYVPKALELSLSPAFYVTPPIDDYRNNSIYINGNPRFSGSDLYTVLAHEGYPGHLYQNVYYRSKPTDNLRQLLGPTGYSEGWATYVEHYSYTLDNGLSPEMGQLLSANTIASLGLQACLDVYINYYGWTSDQVAEYLEKYYGDPGSVVDEIYNTMIENPSNYVSYYVGYMEINHMLELAKKQLGSKFELKQFHEFLLDIGPAPFDVIRPYFTSWLTAQKL